MHWHLRKLVESGEVVSTGKARATRWRRRFDFVFTWPLKVPEGESPPAEHEMWSQAWAEIHIGLPTSPSPQAVGILNYGVTEVLNNAIDHSGGTTVRLSSRVQAHGIEIVITDDGVGALKHVQDHFGLPSGLDAIAHIAKGKQPTDPARHSGQGLFFTSKALDRFELDANGHIWMVDNTRGDTAIGRGTTKTGTRVSLILSLSTTRSIKDVFDRFTDSETHRITKNVLRVSLATHGSEFVSRSEAKRLARGLELYGEVVLDFEEVTTVGQGFVDELFRVWAGANEGTRLIPVNMSPEVEFLVKRGLG